MSPAGTGERMLVSGMKATLRTWTPKIREAAAPVRRWVERFLNYILFMLAVGIAIGVVIFVFEGSGFPITAEDRSAVVRNVGLVLGGLAALWVAVWRSRIAERQADTAQRGLLNERYQRGAAMIGSEVLSVRLAGIYALQRLAEDHPKDYHIQIMSVLCAFVRRPALDQGGETRSDPDSQQSSAIPPLRDDVQTAMEAISVCHKRHWHIEIEAESGLDLHGADLRRARLQGANLAIGKKVTPWEPWIPFSNPFALQTGVNLSSVDLRSADLMFADLQFADLRNATLGGARLMFAKLHGISWDHADLRDADLSGAHFSNAEAQGGGQSPGPSQKQLDVARARPNIPPTLDELTDPDTGKPLVWRGKPLEDTA